MLCGPCPQLRVISGMAVGCDRLAEPSQAKRAQAQMFGQASAVVQMRWIAAPCVLIPERLTPFPLSALLSW